MFDHASDGAACLSRRGFFAATAAFGVAVVAVGTARAESGGTPNSNATTHSASSQNAHGTNSSANGNADRGDPQPDHGNDNTKSQSAGNA